MNTFRWLLPASLGQTVVTAKAEHRLERPDVYVALRRHAGGSRRKAVHASLEGCRVLSVYHDRRGQRFWIITEADHRTTMVMLPEEYGSTRCGRPVLRRVE